MKLIFSIPSILLLAVFTLVSSAESARAFPLPQKQLSAVEAATFTPSRFVEGAVDFTAIVALNNCSGSLVRFTSSLDSDRAMVLTNGHCLESGMPGPGKVVVGASSSRSFKLLTSDGRNKLGTLTADQVMYSTMTGTDLTLYRLKETFQEIQSRYNVTALTMSPQRADAGVPIAIPSGYWKRIYNCSIDTFIHELREAKWTMKDSIRYSQPGCNTIGGTSGSPIVNADTREVIGVNNTGNEDGAECTMNNPCEVDAEGKITVIKKASYGQQTYWVYSCLNSSNQIDLNKAGCQLHH